MSFHWFCRKIIEFFFGQTKGFPHFPEYRTVFEFDIGSAKRNVIFSVFIKNIFEDGVSVLPAPVDIKIWRRGPVEIQETFKIKIQFYWADIGDSQTVTHNRIGSAPTPNVHETHPVAVLNNIPGDEKVRGKFEVANYFKFLFNSFFCCFVVSISFLQTFISQSCQKLHVLFLRTRKIFFVFIFSTSAFLVGKFKTAF